MDTPLLDVSVVATLAANCAVLLATHVVRSNQSRSAEAACVACALRLRHSSL